MEHPKQKQTEPSDAERVYAEDWWSHARPVFELHGYYRLRAELFHRMALGRLDSPNQSLFPQPIDYGYSDGASEWGPRLCTSAEDGQMLDGAARLHRCQNQTNAGANMRFRLNPELHISDNLRVLSQIDLLDNLLLGSTPQGYAIEPDVNGGYRTVQRGGYNPMGAFDVTQEPPTAGVNGWKDSIRVKRVWAEYSTPVGELRFGRMPSHWGLGILVNSGDGYDDDYQTNVDRIMFVTGIKPLDVYLAGGWDFVNEGPNSDLLGSTQGQAYDLAQLDDTDQYMLSLVRRQNPALVEHALTQGQVVVNGGAYVLHRRQLLANDVGGAGAGQGGWVPNANLNQLAFGGGGYVRRRASLWIPDLWLQIRWRKLRFEAEAVSVQGSVRNLLDAAGEDNQSEERRKFREYGVATETEFRAVEDRLKLMFMFGWASGDAEASAGDLESAGSRIGGLVPGAKGLERQLGDDTISTFRFHPNYRVDLLLHRNILSRVQGTYYFRPSVDYDFMRSSAGQRLGGGVAAIWSRASQFVQTPGHRRDLGLELNGKLFFQSKDGALNDQLGLLGGFYTQLEYGVLFPLGGLGYQSGTGVELRRILGGEAAETKAAQLLRWYLGVLF
ncbi:TIGR04551 family protein [Myxococcota bacterium]